MYNPQCSVCGYIWGGLVDLLGWIHLVLRHLVPFICQHKKKERPVREVRLAERGARGSRVRARIWIWIRVRTVVY